MDYISNNNFRGIELVKKLAKQNPNIVPSDVDLENTLSYTIGKEEVAKLASASRSNFADTLNKEYPINSAKNTWLSAVYFYTDGQAIKTAAIGDKATIEENIHLAAEAYGIGDKLDALCDEISTYINQEYTKLASEKYDQKKFAYSDIDDETKEVSMSYLPINNLEEIYKSAKELSTNKDKIPVMIFKKAAENIVKEFNKYSENDKFKAGVSSLPESVKRAGVKFLIDPEKLQKVANARFQITNDPVYANIAKFASNENKSNEDLEIAVDIMCEQDIVHQLNRKYGSINQNIMDPYSATASTISKEDSIKIAKETLCVAGAMIPFEVLKSTKVQEGIQNAFSKEASEKILSNINMEEADAIKFASNVSLSKAEEKLLLEVLIARG